MFTREFRLNSWLSPCWLLFAVLMIPPAFPNDEKGPQLPSIPSILSPPDELHLPNITSSQQRLLDSIESGDYVAARKMIEESQRKRTNNLERLEDLELLAYVDLQQNRIGSAIKHLESAEKIANTSDSQLTSLRIKNFRRLADMYLRVGKKSNAIPRYELALS